MLLVHHLLHDEMKFSWGFDAFCSQCPMVWIKFNFKHLSLNFIHPHLVSIIKMHRPHIEHKLLSSLYWLNNLQFFEMKISTLLRNPFQHKHRNALIRDTHEVKLQIYYKPIHLNLIPTYLLELLYSDSIKR